MGGLKSTTPAGTVWLLCAGSLPFAAAAAGSDPRFSLTAGAEYTTGDYGGSQSVDEWYVPVTGKYETGPYVLRLTVPYLRVTAPSGTVVTGGGGRDAVVPGSGPRTTEDGLGDVIAGVTYRDLLGSERSRALSVDLTGKVKFGTADENKGLGTGEDDYTVQADVYKYLDRWTPFATLGYRFRGDPPGANLNDGWLADVGAYYQVSDNTGVSADYYFREASVASTEDPQELSATLHYRLTPEHKLLAYLIKGFSDGSPDWGAGVMLRIRN